MEDFKVKPILLCGNAVDQLKQLDACSVDCCVTSPPYYGLRDYGTGEWVGGDSNCDHKGNHFATKANINKNCGSGVDRKNAEDTEPMKSVCTKCGAIRVDEQIGLEETPEEYIAKLVDIFREVGRVLRDDGTLWVNIADSYSGSNKGSGGTGELSKKQNTNIGANYACGKQLPNFTTGCKPKDLIGIPWMLAFALRADGWYLRQDIIWHKPNPMPESVKDRCTKSHEYIFLLSKSKKYYYDNQAIMEPAKYGEQHAKKATSWGTNRKHPNKPNVSDYAFKGDNHTTSRMEDGSYGRNKRSVWTVTTKPFKGAHFATFPPDLIEPCILAGSREGGTVLDPFNGSGTTGIAAMNNGRNYVGIDLNAEYLEITRKRFTEEVQYATPLF